MPRKGQEQHSEVEYYQTSDLSSNQGTTPRYQYLGIPYHALQDVSGECVCGMPML